MIRLLGNRVALAPIPPLAVSHGGIHMVGNDDRTQFRVIGVGPGRKLRDGSRLAPEVSIGDKVYAPLTYDHVTLDDGTKIVDAGAIEMVVG